ncbi:MAG: hypothetical protein ACPIOQ_05020 [Promethearchaeia archaeon]
MRAGRNQRGLCCPGTHTLIRSTPGAGTSAARLPPSPSSATRAQAPRGSALPPRPDRQTLATSAHRAAESSTAHDVAERRALVAAWAPRSRVVASTARVCAGRRTTLRRLPPRAAREPPGPGATTDLQASAVMPPSLQHGDPGGPRSTSLPKARDVGGCKGIYTSKASPACEDWRIRVSFFVSWVGAALASCGAGGARVRCPCA